MEIPSYFQHYLRAIQPTKASRERAIQLHTTLTERLAADNSFHDWYAGTFLYGSYRRNTAIQPIKDVDVCVLLTLDINQHKPQAVVQRLRRVLERNGYDAKTALQRRSVRIDMSGTTLDVVPVVSQGEDDQPLWIPDRRLEEWVPTHPKGHMAAATNLNQECGNCYIPFVKIVKAWYRYQLHDVRSVERPKPKGFTLEALVAQYQDSDAPSYAEAFVHFLTNLWGDCGSSLARGTFPDVVDFGMPDKQLKLRISSDEAKRFGTVVKESLAQAQKTLDEENLEASAIAWRTIFGQKFPILPQSSERSAKALISKGVDEDGEEFDDEISEIELPHSRTMGALKISAHLSVRKDRPTTERYPSGGRSLPKGMWLRFSVDRTSIQRPYEVHWTVTNHGREAREAHDLRHTNISEVRWEHTKYRGSHSMTCELLCNGNVLARAKHIVNIR